MNIIFSLIATASIILSGVFGFQSYQNKVELKEENLKLARQQTEFGQKILDLINAYVKLGADATLPIAGMTYTLSGSGVSSSATSITLSSLTIPQTGQKLIDSDFSTTFYLTLEPGNRTRQEIISCTTVTQNASTATLSGCTRGLSPITPYTASTTLQFAHGGGTSVIFSDPPQLFNLYAALGNDEAITGQWTFNTNLPSSTLSATTSNQFTNKTYVDNTVNQGAATSTEVVGGIVELATQIEMASSTDNGANKPTIPQSKYGTSTPSGTSYSGLYFLVSKNNGKLHQLWLDLTEAFAFSGNNTHSGTNLFTASTTHSATTTILANSTTNNALVLNGINYAFPSTDGATSTLLATNGSGSLTWNNVNDIISYDGGATTTAKGVTGTQVYTHKLGRIPRLLEFHLSTWCSTNGTNFSIIESSGVATSTAISQSYVYQSHEFTSTGGQIGNNNAANTYVMYGNDDADNACVQAKVTAITSTTFTLTWDTNSNNSSDKQRVILYKLQ